MPCHDEERLEMYEWSSRGWLVHFTLHQGDEGGKEAERLIQFYINIYKSFDYQYSWR